LAGNSSFFPVSQANASKAAIGDFFFASSPFDWGKGTPQPLSGQLQAGNWDHPCPARPAKLPTERWPLASKRLKICYKQVVQRPYHCAPHKMHSRLSSDSCCRSKRYLLPLFTGSRSLR
jgi:hypothetical protein